MAPGTTAIHPLTPDRWDDLVDLFGPERGANSGCWCLWPRLQGRDWKAMSREARRDGFQGIVDRGPAPGLLAYDGDRAVGWCAVRPRPEYLRFQTAKASRPTDGFDGEDVWAITCFYIRSGHRKQGLTSVLAEAAVDLARASGARAVEACALDPDRPATWGEGFVGFTPVFTRLGFVEVARRSPRRPLMRLVLREA